MDDFAPRSEVRHSQTFATRERSQALTGACIAEAVHALAPEQICITVLFANRAPWVVASRGATLTPEQRNDVHSWARTIRHTEVQATPHTLRKPLRTFRALLSPLSSPLSDYGAVLLSTASATPCSRGFRRELEAVCTDWVLRLEEMARAELRPNPLGRSLVPVRSLAAFA